MYRRESRWVELRLCLLPGDGPEELLPKPQAIVLPDPQPDRVIPAVRQGTVLLQIDSHSARRASAIRSGGAGTAGAY